MLPVAPHQKPIVQANHTAIRKWHPSVTEGIFRRLISTVASLQHSE
jgi:hypothetical protein